MKVTKRGERSAFFGLVAGLLLVALFILSAQGSSPPQITYIDFPGTIQAGESVTGYIFFSDPDGDVAKVKFELVEGERSSLEIKPDWEFDPGVEGETEGTIEFQVIARASQRVTMKVTLFDKAGNSNSSEFSFEAVGNEPPIARFSYSPSKPRAGETVRFDGSTSEDPDGSIVSWSWDFGDDATGSGVTATHTYSAEGSYTVTLQVTDDKGAIGSASKTIEVLKPNRPPVAKFIITPAEPEVGETVTFDASDSYDPDGQIKSYSWAFGDGSSGQGKMVTHSYSSARTYTVTLKVIDDGGLSDTVTHRVTVHPKPQPPVAQFTYSPSQPEVGQPVTFDASGSYDPDGFIKSYEWSFGDGSSGAGETISHSYTKSGSYTVTLKVTDNDGLTNSTSKTVTVVPPPPVADFTASPTSGTAPLTVRFTSTSRGEITSYSWDFGDGSTSTEKNPTHTYRNPGSYTVSLTVRGPGGRDTKRKPNFITVHYPRPVARFTASPTSGSPPLTVHFTNRSENYTSSSWDFGDGTTSTLTNPTHTYRRTGKYTVTLTVRGPGGEDSTSQVITVTWPEGILYQDDFSDPNSGWPIEDWRGYEDGEYSIFMEKAGWWGGSTIPGNKFFDAFCVEVEARAVGRAEGAYGILFGFKDRENNYSFAISTDGWFLVDRMVEGHWIQRARWRESPAIKKGTATNRLKILVDESHNMKFYINDQLVKTMLMETTYEGGEIGIYAWAFEDGFRANFDYIKVKEISRCGP